MSVFVPFIKFNEVVVLLNGLNYECWEQARCTFHTLNARRTFRPFPRLPVVHTFSMLQRNYLHVQVLQLLARCHNDRRRALELKNRNKTQPRKIQLVKRVCSNYFMCVRLVV